MLIWMAQDTEGKGEQSGFGLTKKDAEDFVVQNRGYQACFGAGGYGQAIRDGWAKPAKRIRVPRSVAACLLEYSAK